MTQKNIDIKTKMKSVALEFKYGSEIALIDNCLKPVSMEKEYLEKRLLALPDYKTIFSKEERWLIEKRIEDIDNLINVVNKLTNYDEHQIPYTVMLISQKKFSKRLKDMPSNFL